VSNYPRRLWRRLCRHVSRPTANPGDLPIEQATKFSTIVNLETAKAARVRRMAWRPAAPHRRVSAAPPISIGVDIPPLLLAAADEVIE
jgi:hypothetical protein